MLNILKLIVVLLYVLSTEFFYNLIFVEDLEGDKVKADNVVVVNGGDIPYSWVSGLLKGDGIIFLYGEEDEARKNYKNVMEGHTVNMLKYDEMERGESYIIVYQPDEKCFSSDLNTSNFEETRYFTYLPSGHFGLVPSAVFLEININSIYNCFSSFIGKNERD